ncbi:hypothetical protein pEaSNUABM54_00096 [Erwinia phage pEa_SNUABM_54]|nr:hypothetical protein pEaSNUABM54_00096 [Erwinia phage pEa_SNUABM_54]
MIKPQASWVNALLRLIPLAAIERTGSRSVGNSTTTLITDIQPSGYLSDLLVRMNVPDGITANEASDLIEWINTFTNLEATLVTFDYMTADDTPYRLYGLTVNHVTLWFLGNVPEANAIYQLTEAGAVEVPAKQSGTIVDDGVAVEVLSVPSNPNPEVAIPDSGRETWFDKVGAIPDDQREWLLTQLETAFERIDRKDLFDELSAEL